MSSPLQNHSAIKNVHTVTKENLTMLCEELAKMDGDLGRIFQKYGAPPLWDRKPTFATLVHIILEQQVSLASALSAFNKLKEKVGRITPQNVLNLTDPELRACYFSRQKAGYVRGLAEAIRSKTLNLRQLKSLSDTDAKSELVKIKGIGDWTSDIFLIMALLRPDIMPRGDLALHAAYQNLMNLPERPKSDEFLDIAMKWAPHRSTAARLLWHFYLSEKKIASP